jgi:hypothetical protein
MIKIYEIYNSGIDYYSGCAFILSYLTVIKGHTTRRYSDIQAIDPIWCVF